MPIYEYQCLDCDQAFELLVFGSEEAVCPECGSQHLEKAFSSFGVGRSQATTSAPACEGGTCPYGGDPGSCGARS